MKVGISYLSNIEWTSAYFSRGRGEAISFQRYYPSYRLTPPDPEEGHSVCLEMDRAKLFVVGKNRRRNSLPWKKIKHQFFAHLPALPFCLSPINKRNFFEHLQDHPLYTEWRLDEDVPLSLAVKPKKERVYFYLEAGELGKVKIEEITAEYFLKGQKIQRFEYPTASIEPKVRRGLFTTYYCSHISVDGIPCASMSWKEIQAIASKVQEKVLSLVVFQGWRGTELLFRTPYPKPINERKILIDAEDSWGDKCPIQLQVVQSVYDSHLFIQASFEKKGRRWAIEQIYITPWVLGGDSSLECLHKMEQRDPLLECSQKIQQIQTLLQDGKVFAIIDSKTKAPSLLIAPVGEEKMFFSSHFGLASSARCLEEVPFYEKEGVDPEAGCSNSAS